MSKKHQINLSNGQILQVEEGDNCLHIASIHNDEVDAYICEINPSGVLVMPNSGEAGEWLVRGLAKGRFDSLGCWQELQ